MYKHLTVAGLAAASLALTGAGATSALGGQATASQPTQRFVLRFASHRTVDRPTTALAAGVIADHGTETQRRISSNGDHQVLRIALHLSRGTVAIRVAEDDTLAADLHSCTARHTGRGTWRIVNGTGTYRGASGGGSFVAKQFMVGAFDSSGACLGPTAPPVWSVGNVVADGDVTLGAGR
jgi:hypothetical protein